MLLRNLLIFILFLILSLGLIYKTDSYYSYYKHDLVSYSSAWNPYQNTHTESATFVDSSGDKKYIQIHRSKESPKPTHVKEAENPVIGFIVSLLSAIFVFCLGITIASKYYVSIDEMFEEHGMNIAYVVIVCALISIFVVRSLHVASSYRFGY